MPASADFLRLASDPRGGDAGFAYFPMDANGNGIAFRNFSHDEYGNNTSSQWSSVVDRSLALKGRPVERNADDRDSAASRPRTESKDADAT